MTHEHDGEVNLADRKMLPDESGVYYLTDSEDNVLYVGKSKNLRARWTSNQHHRYEQARSIESVTICWVLHDKSEIDEQEKCLIDTLSPLWNRECLPRLPDLVTIKVYESTRKSAKIAAAKEGVTMAQFIRHAVFTLAIEDDNALEKENSVGEQSTVYCL